jgi:hypothetical protein
MTLYVREVGSSPAISTEQLRQLEPQQREEAPREGTITY